MQNGAVQAYALLLVTYLPYAHTEAQIQAAHTYTEMRASLQPVPNSPMSLKESAD